MSEADYAGLIAAAHRTLAAPVIVIWDNLNTHRSKVMREFTSAHQDWLTVIQLPSYAPDLNPAEMSLPQCEQPRLVALILPGADVSRQRAVDADQPLPGLQPAHPPGVLVPGQPARRIGAAAPVGVDPGIGRVAQHVDQALLMRGPPGDLPLAGPGPLPHPDLDLVLHQEPQHRVHGAQFLEQAEHQPNDRLNLLIRIKGSTSPRSRGSTRLIAGSFR